MRPPPALKLVALAALAAAPHWTAAQDVKTTTTRTTSGERVVRVETTLRQSPETTWKWFSTEEGLKCWVAPLVRLDLRTGGVLETNYDKSSAIGGAGTISLRILNYVENEVMTFKVKLNEAFSERLQSEDDNLQEVIQLQRLPNGTTRLVSSMVGWGSGADWDRAITFFARGNEWSYKELAKCAARSP